MQNSQVLVRTFIGEIIPIDIEASTTIFDLKQKIYRKTNIQVEVQRIIYQGRHLDDSKVVVDFNLPSNSILHVMFPSRGG